MTQFGVEEEFFFLDPDSLSPSAPRGDAHGPLRDIAAPGAFTSEFLTCQIEFATSPVTASHELLRQLIVARAAAAHAASAEDRRLGTVGTPFGTGDAHISPTTRYRKVAAWLADIAGGHHVCGTHVHVEIEDDEERVRGLNRVRPWLPVLLALSGNSPFWHARITGYQSWRTVLMRRLPTMGCPPLFRDHAHYRQHLAHLVALGAAPDTASLAWAARLSERFPTVEVRVFDTQLEAEDAVVLAALTRAILTSDDLHTRAVDADLINASLWMAAREGMDAVIVHPVADGFSRASAILPGLLDRLRPRLQELGDAEFVGDRVERLMTDGTGAGRQIAALRRDGVPGLAALIGAGAEDPSRSGRGLTRPRGSRP